MSSGKMCFSIVGVCFLFSCFGPLDPSDPAPLNNSTTQEEDTSGTTRPVTGLIAYWKCDDTVTSSFVDANGDRNGQRVGGTSDAGIDGGSLQLNGEGDYISVANGDSAFNFGAGDFTLSVWVKPLVSNAEVDSLYPIFSLGELFENGFSLLVKDGYFGAFVGPFKNNTATDSSVLAADDKWHHVVMLRRKSLVELYIDAKRVKYYDSDYAINTDAALMIGRGYSQGVYSNLDHYYRGNIDEIKVLNSGWSSSDVTSENARFEH